MARNFDNLRADIWRFAAREEPSERELIQQLLDTVGPAFDVDRVCFNEPDGDGMICTLEWVAPGIKPSLGSRLPHVVHTHLVRPYPMEITVESSVEAMPPWARPLGGPILRAFALGLNLESVLIVPYSVAGGVVDGVLSFDICRGKSAPRGWSDPLLPVIYEVALIVGQAIARRRAKVAQTASENRYRTLVDNLGEGVGLTGPEEVFVFANRAGDQIFGVPSGGLAGRSVREFVDDAGWKLVREQTGRRASSGRSNYALEICRPDGARRSLDVTCTPEFDESGQFLATFAIFRDMTEQRAAERERRRIESQVQRSQKLESLGVLAGGIAHDFNNILMGILGHSELALQQLPEGHEARDSLTQIRLAALNTSGLTRQLLTYSGKGMVVIEHLDLSKIVREMADLMRAAVSKKAEVRTELGENLPPVEGDPSQLRQVAMNLLTNASDALGNQSGVIDLCTTSRQLDADYLSRAQVGADMPPGRYVCLSVSDTGCGMTPDSQSQMFDPFFSTKFAGRGLGLAAVLGIVRAHRGAITVDSVLGKGTSISVCLPASTRPVPNAVREPAPAAQMARPATARVLVLVVDDDNFVLSSMSRLLGRAGFATLTAGDGVQAIEVFRRSANEISIVILDMTMPEMGGHEALEELRKIRSDIRVILCSGFSEIDLGIKASELHHTGFLQKPYEHEELLRTIRNMLTER
jgi:PAS domain S-box-containing protein